MKKKLTCGYLYADGHAVLVYEKDDCDAGPIEFVEVHEKWTEAQCAFQGRLIFSRYNTAMLDLCKRAKRIEAHEASLKNGSENTQKMGIACGSLTIYMLGDFSSGLHFAEFPSLISGSYTYQPDRGEECPAADSCSWSSHRIARFHPAKREVKLEAIAA